MADFHHLISLGIGSPAGIPHFILLGLSPGSAPVEPVEAAFPLSITTRLEYYDRTSSSWNDFTSDTHDEDGLEIEYGIRGSGPLDNLSGTGIGTFTVGSYDPVGQYSPAHASVRTGWTIGTPIRVWFESTLPVRSSDDAILYSADGDPLTVGPALKFVGRVVDLDPEPGSYGRQRAFVTCEDAMGPLSGATVRQISAQIDTSEMDALRAIFAALPDDTRPGLVQLDDSVEDFPCSLDDVSGGQPAAGLLKDVLDSAFAALVQRGDGVQIVQNRLTRTYADAVDTFTEADMAAPDGLSARSALRELWDRVEVEVPQIVLGDSVEILAAAEGPDTQGIAAGASEEIWMDYRDPNDTSSSPVPIGGTDFLALNDGATDVHYTANANGSGADRTPDMVIVATPFAGSVKFEIQNNAGGKAYRQELRQRGTAIRRFAPVTMSSESAQPYGQRQLQIRLRYQTSRTVAAFIADYVRAQYEGVGQRPSRLAFKALRSERLLQHALDREPLDPIRVTEPVTGVTAAESVIQSVRYLYQQRTLACEWGLAPRSSFLFIDPWQLETAGRGELGDATILG